MPTFEFIGYSHEQTQELIEAFRSQLLKLPFSDEIVFVQRPGSSCTVIGLDGEQRPFVRIFTRTEQKAKILSEFLSDYTEVETVYLDALTPKRRLSVPR